jgi:GTPase SAR1 family protein
MADPALLMLNLGVQAVTRGGPNAVEWFSKFFWNRVVIVGQAEAGKTSFCRYFRHGLFTSERMKRTRENIEATALRVSLGRNEELVLKIKSTIDTVGQLPPQMQAKLCAEKKPHVIIVVLDITRPWGGQSSEAVEAYLDNFMSEFAVAFNRNKTIRNKLQAMIIVLNKKDAAEKNKISTWHKRVESFIKKNIVPLAPELVNKIDVVDCSLIEDFDKGKSANRVLETIALRLQEETKI